MISTNFCGGSFPNRREGRTLYIVPMCERQGVPCTPARDRFHRAAKKQPKEKPAPVAIFHCDVTVLSRSDGRSSTAAAAYRAAEKIHDERSGQSHDYTRKQGVSHSEIITPSNAPDWTHDRSKLWNAVEQAEKRLDAQLAREIIVALPHELSEEQRLNLVREYIKDQFTSQGMIADFAIHAPNKEGDERNHHAHILLTMRDITPEGFGNKNRQWNLKANVYKWRQGWEQHSNHVLEQAGLDCRIDSRSLADKGLNQEPRQHLGVHANAIERKGGQSDRGNQNRAIDARNDTRATLRRELDETNGEIEKILQEISKTRAVFDERDLARALFKHDIDPDARFKILGSETVIKLQGEQKQTLYTTTAVRDTEQAALDAAWRIQQQGHGSLSSPALEQILHRYRDAGRPLDAEQEKAIRHALTNRFSVIQGRAGTGKSFTLNALRETLEREGYQVTGLAPTNTAAKDLREAGFDDARTLHSFLYSHRKALEEGRPLSKTPRVFIVDEAAMIDSQRTKELLQAVEQLNARVVFAGDERQLESIEAGGLFGVFAKTFGETELSTVYRQKEDWQREATQAFARGDTAEGLQAYDAHGAIEWSDKRDQAAAQLVQAWVKERDQNQAQGQNKTSFVFAHSNANVDSLNRTLQFQQIKAGRVKNGRMYQTERGQLWVGEGDRLQFRANDKPNGVYNGSLGTVEKASKDTLTVKLDTGSIYTIDVNAYKDYQLGYAGTVYRGQGKTIDTAFVLYSQGFDKKSAYVAMTRAREQTKLYVAREDAPDLKTVVKNIDSRKHYGASLNYTAKPESRNQNQPRKEQKQDPKQQKEPVQAQEQAPLQNNNDRLAFAQARAEQLREESRQRQKELDRDGGLEL